jgi:hypothetical protein
MTLEEIWQRRSNHDLETAAREIDEYSNAAQQVIQAELNRRGMPEPPISTRIALQRDPNLMGNLVEKVSLDELATNDWASTNQTNYNQLPIKINADQ